MNKKEVYQKLKKAHELLKSSHKVAAKDIRSEAKFSGTMWQVIREQGIIKHSKVTGYYWGAGKPSFALAEKLRTACKKKTADYMKAAIKKELKKQPKKKPKNIFVIEFLGMKILEIKKHGDN